MPFLKKQKKDLKKFKGNATIYEPQSAFFPRAGTYMARRTQAAVVFAGIRKIKRGYYRINLM